VAPTDSGRGPGTHAGAFCDPRSDAASSANAVPKAVYPKSVPDDVADAYALSPVEIP